jgi:hypothetical protein
MRVRHGEKPGFVYVVQCGEFHKIGYSGFPHQRVKSIQTDNPLPVTLIGVIRGSPSTEAEWHKLFSGQRIRGEWFRLTDDDVNRILGRRSESASRSKVTASRSPRIADHPLALGSVLRQLRLQQGLTLREISASSGVSLGYLSEVERGHKEASSELLVAICDALSTSLPQVLREIPGKNIFSSIVAGQAA